MSNTDRHSEIFREEAYELLAELEISLLELEEKPEDKEVVGKVFRAMHTIKGSGAMFGFDEIATFTHEVETVFDLVRNNRLGVTKELIDLTLQARDQIRRMLDHEGKDPADESKSKELIQSFKLIHRNSREQEALSPIKLETADEEETKEAAQETYRVRFKPPCDIYLRGTDPFRLIEEVSALGDCTVIAYISAIPSLDEINPEYCYIWWDLIITTAKGENAIRDVFIFIDDDSEIRIERVHGEKEFDREERKKLEELLMERGDITPEELEGVLREKRIIGGILVESGAVTSEKVATALAEQHTLREMQGKKKTDELTSSIRVSSEKLDSLVNLVGELVTVQARLTQTAEEENNPHLTAIAEEVERLTADLRDTAMGIRMLPIGTTFSKFRRLVRDLSKELGKEIEMVTDGAETELDKTVIEKLNDPLVHLIRNSIDHGIELPQERLKSGKDRKGTIHLSAMHSGAHVLIQIRDNGAGLDTQAIRAKAVEKGLISEDAELSEKEIFSLILAPGFSTASQVTSVSGRGVGMDVVKQAIVALRGDIEIDSRKGEGTTITLKLPLTLAIIDGLLVKIADNYYVLPLSSVKECVELTGHDRMLSHGRHLTNVRNRLVPYIRLREQFSIGDSLPEIEQIVITETDQTMMGFVVDMVIGEHQTVIKSLGSMYRNIKGLSGATILGDGTLALILDVPQLISFAEREEAKEGNC